MMEARSVTRIAPAAALRLVVPPMLWCALVVTAQLAWSATAVGLGRVEGRVIAADTGEPIAYADVLLVPADTTLGRIGMLTNADGTFLLQVAPGLYDLHVRALSYSRKIVTGVRIEEGKLLSIPTSLQPEAIVQQEVVVEARLQQNTEQALLAERRRAAAVGDAISAEQIRRSPDRDAGDVLKRVTGLSVADGKYVYVRGLGERYSSTEVDGVRLTSPEQNKRVVALDLMPAGLLDHITVQKTYTADRQGEFGAGDVQVHTKSFPGRRNFAVSLSQGIDEGTTFGEYESYAGARGGNLFGFGAGSREMPSLVNQLAGGQPVAVRGTDPSRGFTPDTLAMIGSAFANAWSPVQRRARPNGSIQQTYGDELRLFGRSLGIVQSASFGRSYNRQSEEERLYATQDALVYDYGIQRSMATTQLGGMAAISYRLAPSHTLHLRGLYTRNADDEVRLYEGVDYNQVDFTDSPQRRRGTRLRYVERSVASGSLEGKHEFVSLLKSKLEWRLTTSGARRVEPDRRETVYDRNGYYDGNNQPVYFWSLSGRPSPTREFGELNERGWGADASWSLPLLFQDWGMGRVKTGASFQRKDRDNFYRRFRFAAPYGSDTSAPPESLFQDPSWNGDIYGAQIEENTLPQDNYVAVQEIAAGFINFEIPLGRVRGDFGVRLEHALQTVRCFDLFEPDRITAEGRIDEVAWLPAANLRWAIGGQTSLRLAASRTLSRPDLTEFSPSPSLEYVGGLQVTGNPKLKQAMIHSYDLRVETFPSGSELLAAGVFYKDLRNPIERIILGGSAPILAPENAERGRSHGIEIEARASLGRLWAPLQRLTLTTNASWIRSRVRLKPHLTEIGSREHPLEGQPDHLLNGTLSCAFPAHRAEVSILVNAVGRRLEALGLYGRPDIYELPTTTLDAAATWRPRPPLGMKAGGRNLLDTEARRVQGSLETYRARSGRSYSLALSLGG